MIFFSFSDGREGEGGEAEGDGRGGGVEGDGKVGGAGRYGKVLLASTDLRQELGPISELRRSDFSGGRRWPITFPNSVNTLIASVPVTGAAREKTLSVPEATLTDMLKLICKHSEMRLNLHNLR